MADQAPAPRIRIRPDVVDVAGETPYVRWTGVYVNEFGKQIEYVRVAADQWFGALSPEAALEYMADYIGLHQMRLVGTDDYEVF